MTQRYSIILDPFGTPIRKEGKAAPELLRPDLRRLPGELITKEVADATKIHALDEEHTQAAILEDHRKREQGGEQEAEDQAGAEAVRRREERLLTQERVDLVRLRILRALAGNAMSVEEKKRVRHVWFDANDINAYSLRDGNAPADSARPKHLRRLRLEIDLGSGRLPQSVVDKLPPAKLAKYRDHIHKVATGAYDEPPRILLPGLGVVG